MIKLSILSSISSIEALAPDCSLLPLYHTKVTKAILRLNYMFDFPYTSVFFLKIYQTILGFLAHYLSKETRLVIIYLVSCTRCFVIFISNLMIFSIMFSLRSLIKSNLITCSFLFCTWHFKIWSYHSLEYLKSCIGDQPCWSRWNMGRASM